MKPLRTIPLKFWFITILCYLLPFLIEIFTSEIHQVEIQTDIFWFFTIIPTLIFTYYWSIKQGIAGAIFAFFLHFSSEGRWTLHSIVTTHDYLTPLEVGFVSLLLVIFAERLFSELKKEKAKLAFMNQELTKYKEQLNNLFNNLDVAIWSYDLEANHLELSAYFEQLYGYTSKEIKSNPTTYWKKNVVPEDFMQVEEIEKQLLAGNRAKGSFRIRKSDGEIRWVQDRGVPVVNSSGKVVRVDGAMFDITESKLLQEKLESMAYYDQLTKLPNRQIFEEALQTELSSPNDPRASIAVLFIDLDGFKKVNDTLGHHAGDYLLKQVAERLQYCVDQDGLLSRLAGDEFTIMLPHADRWVAEQMAKKIIDALSVSYTIDQEQVFITSSIGISMFPEQGTDPHTLIKSADSAMYQAKINGKNTFRFCTQKSTTSGLF